MKNFFLIFAILIFFISCSTPKYKYPHIQIETKFGSIELELYNDKARVTVAAFLSYVDSGFYKKSSFYRVLKEEDQPSAAFKSELVQGGMWGTDYKKGVTLAGIPHEPTNQTGILHKNGTISLARTTPGTASTEFFICIGDQPAYDYGGAANNDGQGFAAFGKVVKGMGVLKRIRQQPSFEDSFDPQVEILNIIRSK